MPKSTKTPFVLDCGNSTIKFLAPAGACQEASFPHAIVALSQGDYERILQRTGNEDDDLIVVNGQPYAVGEKGQRHGQFQIRYGAERYSKDYYGVFMAIALVRAFQRSCTDVFLIGTHAPKDVGYAVDLMRSAMGTWNVVWKGDKYQFRVIDVGTLDEPIGGWANVVLAKSGATYANQTVSDGTTLVLDVGGFTTDGEVIDPGGEVDYLKANSALIGVIDSLRQFEKDFRSENLPVMKKIDRLDEAQIQQAMRSGVMNLRGHGLVHCEALAQEIKNLLASKVESFYKSHFGGGAAYDSLILTGGGCALIEHELRQRLAHNNIILAEQTAKLYMANAYGGLKWYKLHVALGTWGTN